MRKLMALLLLLPGVALADTTIKGPITFKSPSTTVSGSSVSVPTATTSVFGLVKPDGVTVTISGGVISTAGGGPASPFNSLQRNAAGSFGPAAISDDGATIAASEPTVITVPGTLGSELLSNPTFVSNDTGWTLGSADTAWSSGLFTTTCCTGGDESVSIDVATVAGHYYKVHVDFTITGDQNYIHFNNNNAGSDGAAGPNQDFIFQANYTGTDQIFFDFNNYNPGAVRLMTGASVKEIVLPGAPFTIASPDGTNSFQIDALGNVSININPNGGDAANLKISNLPSADPAVSTSIWANQGVLMLSGASTPWLTAGAIPNSDLLGGTGSAFTSVHASTGLTLSGGNLTTTVGFSDPGVYPEFAVWTGANAIDGALSLTAPAAATTTSAGRNIQLTAGTGGATSGAGGNVGMQAGAPLGANDLGGNASLIASDGNGSGTGGTWTGNAGSGTTGGAWSGFAGSGTSSPGGAWNAAAGASDSQFSASLTMKGAANNTGGGCAGFTACGDIFLQAAIGRANNVRGGDVTIAAGTGNGIGRNGEVIVTITRTSCTSAPSGALANITGILHVC